MKNAKRGISLKKLGIVATVASLIMAGIFIIPQKTKGNSGPVWPQDNQWIFTGYDPNEGGASEDERDVNATYYYLDSEYLYLRMYCLKTPNFTLHNNKECRYQWFIDTDPTHNMYRSGSKIVEAEYILLIEDTPNNGGDGTGDIYLLFDNDNDGDFDEYEPWSSNHPPPITNLSVVGYRIVGQNIDLYVRLANISSSTILYLTWATDNEGESIDEAPTLDRSDIFFGENATNADLGVIKTDDHDPALKGDYLIYTINVTNYGPNNASNVNVTDVLPTGVTFNNATPFPSGGSYPTYWWNLGNITVGNYVIITINVTINNNASGAINNTVNVTSDVYDPTPGNNQDIENTTIGNSPPVAVDDSYTTDEDVVLIISAPGVLSNDYDIDGDTLTAELVSNPSHGSVVLNSNGSFTYIPEANYHGEDSFTYKAYDGIAYSNIATVTITINSTNDAPIANDDSYTTDEDVVLIISAPGV
ncbi:MAG: Ig-like domain-containing protein, partial [Candidatus Thermoplasmatota archaeon]